MARLKLGALFIALLVLAAVMGFAMRYVLVQHPAPPPPAAARAAQPPAPKKPVDFTLEDLHGHAYKLSKWRGNVVLLNFWATWCPPCRREIPMLVRLQSRYARRGLQIIGIAADEANPATVRSYIKKMDFNYPVLWGHGRAADIAWDMGTNLIGLPYTIIIGPDGRVLKRHAGELDSALVQTLLQDKLTRAK